MAKRSGLESEVIDFIHQGDKRFLTFLVGSTGQEGARPQLFVWSGGYDYVTVAKTLGLKETSIGLCTKVGRHLEFFDASKFVGEDDGLSTMDEFKIAKANGVSVVFVANSRS